MSRNDAIANNKRIAKNTIMLYFRMIVVTLLSLITVKYTLSILGISDYGIYNIVGGVVTFLTFVTATVSSATQRFLAFELGCRNEQSYNNTFNMTLALFGLIALVLLVLFEGFAYVIIYDCLKIPVDRLGAAMVVYQTSVFAFLASVLAIPFMSSILANEKLGVYAYITIADTVAKLLLLALLFLSPYDKLLSYAWGMLVVAIATNFIYVFYNQRWVPSTSLRFYWDVTLFRRLASYTGWSFFGSVSSVLCHQGLTILMNLFFGVTVNAAKAVADKIMTIVQSFVTNFYMAVAPQITKTYAAGELDYTVRLAYSGTRLAYYLMFLISTPVILLMDDILHLWLRDTCTMDMVVFTQLSLVFALVNVFETPVTFMVRATGDIKRYQVYVGIFTLMVVPVSYLLFEMGMPAYMAFVCEIVIYAIVQIVRVWVLRSHYPITIRGYFNDVMLLPIVITSLIVAVCAVLFMFNVPPFGAAVLCMVAIPFAVWTIGLKDSERQLVSSFCVNKIKCIIT